MRQQEVTTNRKSDKEIAFLQDLFIAPDWGERFAEIIDEHVTLPKEGEALYVNAGTGGHALALHERADDKLQLLCVDETGWLRQRLSLRAQRSGSQRRDGVFA